LKTKEVGDLDIKSFNFLIEFLYIEDGVYENLIIDEETIKDWKHSYEQKSDIKIINKKQIPSAEWGKLRCLKGDHRENVFGNIEIKKEGFIDGERVMLEDSFVSLRLFYNNQNPELNSYDWEITNSDYHHTYFDNLPTNDFLAMFPDLDEI